MENKNGIDVTKEVLFEVDVYSEGKEIKTIALCKSLEDAMLVKNGLESIYPKGFHSIRGNKVIDLNNSIKIRATFPDDVEEFVK